MPFTQIFGQGRDRESIFSTLFNFKSYRFSSNLITDFMEWFDCIPRKLSGCCNGFIQIGFVGLFTLNSPLCCNVVLHISNVLFLRCILSLWLISIFGYYQYLFRQEGLIFTKWILDSVGRSNDTSGSFISNTIFRRIFLPKTASAKSES